MLPTALLTFYKILFKYHCLFINFLLKLILYGLWGHRESLQSLERKVQVKIKHTIFLLRGNSASRCTAVPPLLFMISFLFQGNRKNKAHENLVNCLVFVHGMGRKSNTKEVFVLSICRLIPYALDLITYQTLQEGEAQQ